MDWYQMVLLGSLAGTLTLMTLWLGVFVTSRQINHIRHLVGIYLRIRMNQDCSGHQMHAWLVHPIQNVRISRPFFYACMARFEDEGWVIGYWLRQRVGDRQVELRMYTLTAQAQDRVLHGQDLFLDVR